VECFHNLVRVLRSMKYNRPVMTDLFKSWKQGLSRSSKAAFGRLAGIFGATEITEATWEDLEALLIQADLGLETTTGIIDSLRGIVRKLGLTRSSELQVRLEAELRARLDVVPIVDLSARPTVILLV
jgi:fused signal recognition particle receptor